MLGSFHLLSWAEAAWQTEVKMRMDFIWLFVLNLALGLSNQEPASRRPNCIPMTPEKEQQIDTIVEKVSDFLNTLTAEHELFDIRLIKLAIEQHSDDEEEKETVLQLSVNDCQLNDDELEDIDRREEVEDLESGNTKADATAKEAGKKNFDVMYLNLEENGQQLVDALDKKSRRPRLVYVQKDRGQLNYMFYKK